VSWNRRTLGKEAVVARLGVLAQEPAIAKVVVALDELDAVSAPQTQLVGAAGQELVCSARQWWARGAWRAAIGSRTDYDQLVARATVLGVVALHAGDGGGRGGSEARRRRRQRQRQKRGREAQTAAVTQAYIGHCSLISCCAAGHGDGNARYRWAGTRDAA
jgi:hypothetical protein